MASNVSADLKRLETEKHELQRDLDSIRNRQRALDDEARPKAIRLKAVNEQMAAMRQTANGLIVSEHAIVRYFERVMGFDLDDVRTKICGGDPKSFQLGGNGTATLPIDGTHQIRVNQNIVTTLTTKDDQIQ